MTSLRFTSIEPFDCHIQTVREIASRHGFEIEFDTQSTVNGAFCGFDYHVQDVYLSRTGCPEINSETLGYCLLEFSAFEAMQMADGYFEILS